MGDRLKRWWQASEEKFTLNLSYRATAIGGVVLVVLCCAGLAIAGWAIMSPGGPAGLLAGATLSETQGLAEIESQDTATPTSSATPTLTATSSPTLAPSPTSTAPPAPTGTPPPTPTLGPTPEPRVIVVTATPTPEPPPTATPVVTATPEGGAPPGPTATEAPAFEYPAPELLEPENNSTVPGVINYLKWEPVGPLADNEWYAVRVIFLEQGEPVYAGNRVKVPEWRVPDRFYYQADGPALQYRWYVFVERDNPDGSATQLSPDSETFVFRWE